MYMICVYIHLFIYSSICLVKKNHVDLDKYVLLYMYFVLM